MDYCRFAHHSGPHIPSTTEFGRAVFLLPPLIDCVAPTVALHRTTPWFLRLLKAHHKQQLDRRRRRRQDWQSNLSNHHCHHIRQPNSNAMRQQFPVHIDSPGRAPAQAMHQLFRWFAEFPLPFASSTWGCHRLGSVACHLERVMKRHHDAAEDIPPLFAHNRDRQPNIPRHWDAARNPLTPDQAFCV